MTRPTYPAVELLGHGDRSGMCWLAQSSGRSTARSDRGVSDFSCRPARIALMIAGAIHGRRNSRLIRLRQRPLPALPLSSCACRSCSAPSRQLPLASRLGAALALPERVTRAHLPSEAIAYHSGKQARLHCIAVWTLPCSGPEWRLIMYWFV